MSKWTDEELRELEEDEDQWDWDHGELVEPSPPEHRGARVVVRLERDEFRRLGVAADQAGERLTEFIRNAALARAKQYGSD